MTPDPDDQSTPPSGYHVPQDPHASPPRQAIRVFLTMFLPGAGAMILGTLFMVVRTTTWHPGMFTLGLMIFFIMALAAAARLHTRSWAIRLVFYGGIILATVLLMIGMILR